MLLRIVCFCVLCAYLTFIDEVLIATLCNTNLNFKVNHTTKGEYMFTEKFDLRKLAAFLLLYPDQTYKIFPHETTASSDVLAEVYSVIFGLQMPLISSEIPHS